jgi:carboxyl-terminal processing protease
MKIYKLMIAAMVLMPWPLLAQNDSAFHLKKLSPEPQHPISEKLLAEILSRYHYQKVKIDDQFSENVFNKYLSLLDNGRIYFLKSDIDKFEGYKKKIDNELNEGKSEIGFDIYNVYLQRLSERLQFSAQVLKDTFDFSKDEYYAYDREKKPWFDDIEDQNNFWIKRLKYEALSLKLSGKNGKEINELLIKRYDNFKKQVSKSRNEDAFQTYMNSITGCADPHTDYFSPRAADDFKVNMTQSLEGIGATLTLDGDLTKIRELSKGGPADKSKVIFAGDKISAVGQGKDSGEMVDVVGWRLDEVVGLIRGKKGSWVRLQVTRASAAPGDPQEIVKIQRDEIKLEEARAKGEVKVVKEGKKTYKIGVINLPLFYQGKTPDKGTSADIERLIDGFKKEKIQALVMDLRNNTGGSLQEAIWLSGLFIKKGPVVQVKHALGNVDVNEDEDDRMAWDGPMAVLVNRGSASASEIFAAALQDYGRAVIIGEQTFGKGTVQNVVDMNNMGVTTETRLGQVKITIAKFYRVDGGSTQHRGVIPDISFPSLTDTSEFGESSDPYALKYDEVSAAPHDVDLAFKTQLEGLKKQHEQRMLESKEYHYLIDDAAYYAKQREEKMLPLNEEVARKKQKDREKTDRERNNERRKAKGLKPLAEGEKADAKEGEEQKVDFELDETNLILIDMTKKQK